MLLSALIGMGSYQVLGWSTVVGPLMVIAISALFPLDPNKIPTNEFAIARSDDDIEPGAGLPLISCHCHSSHATAAHRVSLPLIVCHYRSVICALCHCVIVFLCRCACHVSLSHCALFRCVAVSVPLYAMSLSHCRLSCCLTDCY